MVAESSTTTTTTSDGRMPSSSTNSNNNNKGLAPIKPQFLKKNCPRPPYNAATSSADNDDSNNTTAKRKHANVDPSSKDNNDDDDDGAVKKPRNNNDNDDDHVSGDTPMTDAINSNDPDNSNIKKNKDNKYKRNAGGVRTRGGGGSNNNKPGGSMNTNRPRSSVRDPVDICNELASTGSCPRRDSCKYDHDLAKYLAAKPSDLADRCILFDLYGKCRFGIRCRFANAHVTITNTPDATTTTTTVVHTNIVDEAKVAAVGSSLNLLNSVSRDQLHAIKKCKVPTPAADDAIAWVDMHRKYIEAKDNVQRSILKLWSAEKAAARATDATTDADPTVAAAVVADSEPQQQQHQHQQSHVHQDPEGEDLARLVEKLTPELRAKYETITRDYESHTIDFADRFPDRRVRNLDLRGKLYLAPLTTVGNVPFRRVAKRFGADITCGEMAVSNQLLAGHAPEWALLRRHPSEDIFGVQISAHNPIVAAKACDVIKTHCPDIDFVDLNCGCPIDLIFKQGAGSALTDRRNKLQEIVVAMSRTLDVPVSVKLRTGVKDGVKLAHKLVPMLWESGARILTLHGRSKEQRYAKTADWDYIRTVSKAAMQREAAGYAGANTPSTDILSQGGAFGGAGVVFASATDRTQRVHFFGNGDVASHEDHWRRMDECHRDDAQMSGIMIGRAALMKPWVFTEIKERRVWDIRSSERLDMLRDFANFGMEHWGTDTQGLNMVRRYLLEWLSFLHRYIPVGLLEVLPQRLNDRPPPFYGRDELETLLASPAVTDWFKITEMFLGKTPANFEFVPKHKSNSYSAEAGLADDDDVEAQG